MVDGSLIAEVIVASVVDVSPRQYHSRVAAGTVARCQAFEITRALTYMHGCIQMIENTTL